MAKPKKYIHRGRVDFIEEVPQKNEDNGVWIWAWIAFFVILLLASCGG